MLANDIAYLLNIPGMKHGRIGTVASSQHVHEQSVVQCLLLSVVCICLAYA
jgi:hypothetical protein